MGSYNKKSRSPGYRAGSHWVECMRTGRAIRAEDARTEWTGLVVAREEWEPRHPQEFLRPRADTSKADGLVNPESTGIDIAVLSTLAIAGGAVAGYAIAGTDYSSTLLSGTFNTNTL